MTNKIKQKNIKEPKTFFQQRIEKRNEEIIAQLISGKTISELSGIYKLNNERIKLIGKKAGLDYKKLRHKEEFSRVMAKAKEINRQPSAQMFYELGIISSPIIKYYRQELEKQGFKKIRVDKGIKRFAFSNEELLQDLKAVADKLGKTPSIKDIIRHCKYSHATYKRYFGSIINAQQAAGLISNKSGGHLRKGIKKYTQEQILSDLKELATRINRTPIGKDIKENGKWSYHTLRNYFGSTAQAMKQAGLKPRYR